LPPSLFTSYYLAYKASDIRAALWFMGQAWLNHQGTLARDKRAWPAILATYLLFPKACTTGSPRP